MSTFQYQPSPKAGGGLTTRMVLDGQVDETALLAQAATAGGITPDQARLAIVSFLEQMLTAAAASKWSDGLLGLIRFRPSSGGRGMSPEDFTTPDSIEADVRLSFLAERIATWRQTLILQSLGEVGLLTPVIDKVMNLANNHENEYTAGDMIRLRGDYLRVDKSDPLQGVFIRKSDNTEVRCTVYGSNEPSQLDALVPAGVTGPITVRVATLVNGMLRTFTYSVPVTASV